MGIDIGKDIQKIYSWGLLDRLLKDKTTGRSILWATDAYSALGMRYGYDEPFSPVLITGANAGVIQARAQKGQARRDKRTRQHGEVCTPLWVVKKMVDYADEVWFGAPERFFAGGEPMPRVQFDRENDWRRYVDSRRLEITCGEAPYLATRYDVETGEELPLARRIGILDRKLRVVNENAADADWLYWAARAFEACYGYELQGDSLLTARVNLLMTFRDYYKAKWHRPPAPDQYRYILNRIVWNVWQMDGLTGTLPCAEEKDPRLTLADLAGASAEEAPPIPPPRCRIYNWRRRRSLEYLSMQGNGAKTMKFDYILGNPPYQEENNNNGRKQPIYNYFMDESFKIAPIVELITPARFLFDAGQTPKAWNRKMLSDKHFKVLEYESNATNVFANTEIKGGVAITIRNLFDDHAPVGLFKSHSELEPIIKKVKSSSTGYLNTMVSSRGLYRFTTKFYQDHPQASKNVGAGTGNMIVSNVFDKLTEVFHENRPEASSQYIKIIGRTGNKRTAKYIKSIYVFENEYLTKYNVLLPKSSGSGKFGEVLSQPMLLGPNEGATDSFISIGHFDTKFEAEALLLYLRTKFARTMLAVHKVTQDNARSVWRMVPLQNFTPASDIDWSQPVAAIDRQLYAKYGLDEQEVAFIESHVKEME